MFETPILFIIYNRPVVTKKVFQIIRKIQPSQLFIVADGPKNDKDRLECEKTRELIKVNWKCDYRINFRTKNHGCKKSVSSAISWAFKYVEKLIILEDDILPDISFFTFCSLLLDKYADNNKVMSITGVNWLNSRNFLNDSYYFSNYSGIWGWATWRDRWLKYDPSFKQLGDNNFMDKIVFSNKEKVFHLGNFYGVKEGSIDSWGFVWHYSHFVNNGYCIVPKKNLIKNIGFGVNATHTKNPYSWKAERKSFAISFPLKHPKTIERNKKADQYVARRNFLNKFTLLDRLYDKLYSLVN